MQAVSGLKKKEIMKTATELFLEAFNNPRTPRSEEYKEGCLAAMRSKESGRTVNCPYLPGTASFDAWFAGWEEGLNKWAMNIKGKI